MLEVHNLCKSFDKGTVNEKRVFDNLNLNVNKGEFVTIIGSNGAGKSTLLNIIAGSLESDSGEIILDNKNITRLPEYKRSAFMGRVLQDPSKGVAPSMTILENMSMAYNKGKSFNLTLGVSKKNISHFKEMLSQLNLGLENKLNDKVGVLSGGQRQALSLLMAVMKKPKLLLLDEHTAALDPKTSQRLNSITEEIIKESLITTLMITHNMNHAISMGNRLLMMHEGEIVLDISGESKKHITVKRLLDHFDSLDLGDSLSDRALLA
ncbi:ABC transporter ATP-binding protein [Clostridium polynesiense]|uniref:ABC transporter ATP-binding protein n=1 Tax=Clostridium polynesiense TaxID=1325933 RepID=UPI00059169CF|nr:ATP-binding cassette domain-containing protein [Clostridium polynesiense]